ncbi:MAG: Fe-S cluster assembly protein SufD [Rhodospirillaceae bacterium]|nr:Fe-S cluster assembly protein SufD [Rhodospirillaceae bacterium]
MRAAGLLDHPFREAYAAKLGALPGAVNAWVDGLRQSARAVLNMTGLPGPKTEAWKFTPLGDLAKIPFIPAALADDVDVRSVPIGVPVIPGAKRIVLVNGVLRPDLSDPLDDRAGLRIQSFRQALAGDAASLKDTLGGLAGSGALPLVALNTAYMADGMVIRAARDAVCGLVHVISIGAAGAEPVAFHPRHMIVLESGAALTVVETHVGLPGQIYLANPVTEISLADHASLQRYVAVDEDGEAFHLATTAVSLAAGATFEGFHLALGGGKVRQEVQAALHGAGANCRINGVYGLSGKTHHDLTTTVHHLVPRGTSSQLIKGVVDDTSHAVFQGRIHVAHDAQKTDARQLHKALFLAKGPQVDCKPELEIFADDVQCAHGAATGEIDPAHLFYLMARGIDRDTARAMLVSGFLEEAVDTIGAEIVRGLFSASVQNWLSRRALAQVRP